MNEVKRINDSFIRIKDEILKVLMSAGYITGLFLMIVGFILLLAELGKFYKINHYQPNNRAC